MKFPTIAAMAASIVLAACEGPARVVDPHHPVVDGTPMTQGQYLQKFCKNRPSDPTCIAVGKAFNEDATKPNQPKGW